MIGPDLTAVGDRQSAQFIRRMVSDPQGALPGTLMPKTPMPDGWRELIVRYLVQRRTAAAGDLRAALAEVRWGLEFAPEDAEGQQMVVELERATRPGGR